MPKVDDTRFRAGEFVIIENMLDISTDKRYNAIGEFVRKLTHFDDGKIRFLIKINGVLMVIDPERVKKAIED